MIVQVQQYIYNIANALLFNQSIENQCSVASPLYLAASFPTPQQQQSPRKVNTYVRPRQSQGNRWQQQYEQQPRQQHSNGSSDSAILLAVGNVVAAAISFAPGGAFEAHRATRQDVNCTRFTFDREFKNLKEIEVLFKIR